MVTQMRPEETPHPQFTLDPSGERHDPCDYFNNAYSRPDSTEGARRLLAWAATFRDFDIVPRQAVSTAIADVAQTESYPARPIDTQETRAEKVYKRVVDCLGCVLRDICPIKPALETAITVERKARESEHVKRQMEMFTSGPEWLIVARLHAAGMSTRQFRTMIEGAGAEAATLRKKFNAETLLGGIQNQHLPPLDVEELPEELAKNLTSARHAEFFETHKIAFGEGMPAFAITDLSAENGYAGRKPTEKAFGILTNKLLTVMRALDENGLPAILRGSLLRSVRTFDGGFVTEVRMTGKSRLYVAVLFGTAKADFSDEPMYRLLILGSHGDDEQAQQHFYDQTGLSGLPR